MKNTSALVFTQFGPKQKIENREYGENRENKGNRFFFLNGKIKEIQKQERIEEQEKIEKIGNMEKIENKV